MTAPFPTQLRARRTIELVPAGAGTITIRVQVAELWKTVRVLVTPATPVGDVKTRVLAALQPDERFPDDFVLKLHGWEMLDEGAPLGESGVVNGSILLLADRRRRPVR